MARVEHEIFRNLANIVKKKDPPKDNERYKDEKNKFEKYFKENL